MNQVIWNVVVLAMLLDLVYCKLELEITNGKIKGQLLKSRDGRPFYSYTGIPYAKPPIGELRFKAPKPVERWNGTLDATKKPNQCIDEKISGCNEDCLYLNVYSPKSDKNILPVMVWIHGGSFSEGYSGTFGPEYFMDKDVILVTINYRLGVLGFLSTEDDIIPGNYGMKDQVEALRWVKKNIVYFNGNPYQVTIFGGSAGGASVGFHMLSPMSKGLFHKAILQSGTPVCRWAILPPGIPRKRANTIATIAGCNYNTSEDILNCLKKFPADYIIRVQTKLYAWLHHPYVLFSPVVENCDSDPSAFLCNHPIYDFKQVSFVPAIFGVNSGEGGMFVSSLYNTTSLVRTEFRENFNRLLSIMLHYNHFTKDEYIDEIGQLVLKEYLPSGTIDDDSRYDTANIFTDEGFIRCTLNMAKQLSSPVYGYYYDYQNKFSFDRYFSSCVEPIGVAHCDELTSLFKMSSINPDDLNAKDLEVSKLVVNIWYKFVSSETPTIDGSDGGDAWPVLNSNKKLSFLHINSAQPKIIQNPFGEKYTFWDRISHYFQPRRTSLRKSPCIKNEL